MEVLDFVVSAGHGEYWPEVWTNGDNFPAKVVWYSSMVVDGKELADQLDGVTIEDEQELWTHVTGLKPERLNDEWDLQWEIIVHIRILDTDLLPIVRDLAVQLMRTPSGDDDTFDYWPSGVRFALALARGSGNVDVERLVEAAASVALIGSPFREELLIKCGIGC